MFLGRPSIRFVKAKLIGPKLWLAGSGANIAKVKKKQQQVSHPGPSWPSFFKKLSAAEASEIVYMRERVKLVNSFDELYIFP